MKTRIRVQSHSLNRRSYKPARLTQPVRISFRPTHRVTIPVRQIAPALNDIESTELPMKGLP